VCRTVPAPRRHKTAGIDRSTRFEPAWKPQRPHFRNRLETSAKRRETDRIHEIKAVSFPSRGAISFLGQN